MKSALHQFQNERLNAGWRIQVISHGGSGQSLMMKTNWLALLGALGFIAGIGLAMAKPEMKMLGLKLAVGSWVFAMLGIWVQSRKQVAGWQITPARCVDRELQCVGPDQWYWRIVCDYEFEDVKYRVTPEVQWRNCISKSSAETFLNEKISADGSCRLIFNPENPLQTKLLG
jgi:hypothetical protein